MRADNFPEQRIRALAQSHEVRVAGARDRLLSEAFVLFYASGIRAVGIDLVISRAGVAKASFYRHFPSKAELIVAYVTRRHDALLAWLMEDVSARAEGPQDRLVAIFDSLGDLFADPEFRGCPVINAVAEVGADSEPVVAEALRCKAATRDWVLSLAKEAGLKRPDEAAHQWELLIDGAFVAAQRTKDATPARDARHTAELLLRVLTGGAAPARRRSVRP
ncbi:MAG TPA: TetR/AcrR family transcriptional regulator [Acidimicrobiales bacterium]|jgi:AcrR family transcriptional regulator|nr:TetR/AcrR family transcriptional regulator [Acidimicrobiales bacterium]